MLASDEQNNHTGSSSGGPATQNGKAVVRWNATRHGISSPSPVVPGLESKEDWQEYCDGILENLSPVGSLEVTLAERVALLSWRLHRVTRYETETIALSQQKIEGDIHDRNRILRTFRESPYASTHPEDVRSEARHNQASYNALKRFVSSQRGAGRKLKSQDASAVVFGVYMTARKLSGKDFEWEDVELPGIPEDHDIYEPPPMQASDVQRCVEAIAAHIGQDPDELLEVATVSARLDASSAKGKAEELESEIDVMSRERILPGEKTLGKITRYEAHLSRQLYHALHELENLQKHRTTGEGVPLARLDVQVLSED